MAQEFEFPKDPRNVAPYAFAWDEATEDNPIVSAVVRVVAGEGGQANPDPSSDLEILTDPPEIVGSDVRVMIGGGTVGSNYRVECEVTFASGMILNEERTLKVRNR